VSAYRRTAAEVPTITVPDLTLAEGTSSRTASAVSETPVTIPAQGTVASTQEVTSAAGPLTDVNVTLNITHPAVQELEAVLVGPSGIRVRLFDGVGGSGDNFVNTMLNDQAGPSIFSGAAPFTGSFRPDGRLSDLTAGPGSGTWRLEITDTAGSASGALNSWSLGLTTAGTTRFETTAMLSSPSTLPVSFEVVPTGGTAVAGRDYQGAPFIVEFSPGETQKTIGVDVFADRTREPDEFFFLEFRTGVNGTLPSSPATWSSLDDDPNPTWSFHPEFDRGIPEGNAGARSVSVPLRLSNPSALPVSVLVSPVDGTARRGEDYDAAPMRIEFSPGATTGTYDIRVSGDVRPEPDETFFLELSDPENAVLNDQFRANFTILNDDFAVFERGRVRGNGVYDFDGQRARISLNVRSDGSRARGMVTYRFPGTNQWAGTQFTGLRFERTSTGATAFLTGTTVMQGQTLGFSIVVGDNGSPGRGRDTAGVTVERNGGVIHDTGGLLIRGNLIVRQR
jgi:subtilisin-like proprotein convertase family protein